MTQTASDDWWQRSLDRLGVKPRPDNDAAQIMDVVRPVRTELSEIGAINPTS